MVLTSEVIGFTTLAASLISILGFVMTQGNKHDETKRGIYRRMDEERTAIAETYVRKDIHDTKYESIEQDVSEIKADVKKLLGKSGLK
jgi:hypothetical protein